MPNLDSGGREAMAVMQPRVVDISHHNKVTDLKLTAMAGVWGVIHKASQGQSYRDPDYSTRRGQARAAGLLFGAYHFNDGTDVEGQVDNFLTAAAPDDDTLLVLDFEDNAKSNMSVQQAVQFLRLMEERTGRKAAIYSGNRLKESIGKLSSADRAYVCEHRLWLCQYGRRAVLPNGFDKYWLWQYTGDGIGPQPHGIPGVAGTGIDLNVYQGTKDQLRAEWAPSVPESLVSSSRLDEIEDSQSAHARQSVADDDSDEGPINIQPQKAAYRLDTEIVQRKLDQLGYHEVGDIDGKWGGKTKGAITAFLNDRGVKIGEVTSITPAVTDAISDALGTGWTRPIAVKRATATAEDIAPKVEAVRQSIWQRFVAKITGASAGGVAVVTGVGSQFGAVNEHLSPIKEFFANVPGWAWFAIIAAGALALWLSSNKATVATTQAYNTGKIN